MLDQGSLNEMVLFVSKYGLLIGSFEMLLLSMMKKALGLLHLNFSRFCAS